ncbi:unnamed protein product [Didymodactylos carnosus]|uniref:E3 ubiquitin-protein ligase RNF10 n=1 Tax=Didymodactylos carnosus TaxID=1234261 RepID=A0A814IRI1_9BILA|nr:unnamed protein product [Didymodactylos carnosus]CAF1026990.1 unnamed protein product [Didymodactylos carnosus]CAF3614801.1 unnamed protein product [Didymodactylos carnosus]CAF3798079.1 unnamed protein product [Didymodactylos carnosus]
MDLDDGYIDIFDDDKTGFDLDETLEKRRGKKTNVNHLLNFHFLEKQRTMSSYGRRGYGNGKYQTKRFSKEQFLQANCQFVVEIDGDYSLHFADPDKPIDWTKVEQIRLCSSEQLKCPICLCQPIAGKITRCGHVYCWSCILHYLALSDKQWRKCPICFESIYKQDLKSVRGLISRVFKSGDLITFRLMHRERGSSLFYPRHIEPSTTEPQIDRLLVSNNYTIGHNHSSLLLADYKTILVEIIEKEKYELLKQLQDEGDQPEAIFIKQALEEIEERDKIIREKLNLLKLPKYEQQKSPNETIKQDLSSENVLGEMQDNKTVNTKSAVVYEDAFDNVVISPSREDFNEEKLSDDLSAEEYSSNSRKTSEYSIEKENQYYMDQEPESPTTHIQHNRHFFYQADNVSHAYLNGINARILLHEYGSYLNCPEVVHAKVEHVESFFMTEELRSHFRFLGHIPLTCEFQVIEIRLRPPVISMQTMNMFADELYRRRQFRYRKERMEKRLKYQAEVAETKKLTQYPTELMYLPSEHFPVNSTQSMEEFPAMTPSTTSSSPPSASAVLTSEENGPSFAQMLKQRAPSVPLQVSMKKVAGPLSASIMPKEDTRKNKKNNKCKNDSDDDYKDVEGDDHVAVPNFHTSFSQDLEAVFDKLKVNNATNGANNEQDQQVNSTGKNGVGGKKKKKTKQLLFATGMGQKAK